MEIQSSNQPSGSAVERNVIDFLAHRKSATQFIHGNTYEIEERSSEVVNCPRMIRMQPPPGKRSYLCNSCGQPFLDPADLETHSRVCDKLIEVIVASKPYTCHLCGNTYEIANHLDIHMKVQHLDHHSNNYSEKVKGIRYTDFVGSTDVASSTELVSSSANEDNCTEDEDVASTSSNDSLIDKIVTVVDASVEEIQTGGKLYKCSECGLSNDITANLYKHMKTNHPEFNIVHKRDLLKKMKSLIDGEKLQSFFEFCKKLGVEEFSDLCHNGTYQVKNKKEKEAMDPGQSRSEKFANDPTGFSGENAGLSHEASSYVYQCAICHKTFSSETECGNHLKSHKGKSVWDYSAPSQIYGNNSKSENSLLSRQNTPKYAVIDITVEDIESTKSHAENNPLTNDNVVDELYISSNENRQHVGVDSEPQVVQYVVIDNSMNKEKGDSGLITNNNANELYEIITAKDAFSKSVSLNEDIDKIKHVEITGTGVASKDSHDDGKSLENENDVTFIEDSGEDSVEENIFQNVNLQKEPSDAQETAGVPVPGEADGDSYINIISRSRKDRSLLDNSKGPAHGAPRQKCDTFVAEGKESVVNTLTCEKGHGIQSNQKCVNPELAKHGKVTVYSKEGRSLLDNSISKEPANNAIQQKRDASVAVEKEPVIIDIIEKRNGSQSNQNPPAPVPEKHKVAALTSLLGNSKEPANNAIQQKRGASVAVEKEPVIIDIIEKRHDSQSNQNPPAPVLVKDTKDTASSGNDTSLLGNSQEPAGDVTQQTRDVSVAVEKEPSLTLNIIEKKHDNQSNLNPPAPMPVKHNNRVTVLSILKPVTNTVQVQSSEEKTVHKSNSSEKQNSIGKRRDMGRKHDDDSRYSSTGSSNTVRVVDIPPIGAHRYKCSVCDFTSNCTSNLYGHMKASHKDMTIVKKRVANRVEEDPEMNGSFDNSQNTTGKEDIIDLVSDLSSNNNTRTVRIIANPSSTDGNQHKCSECSFTSSDTDNLYQHMENRHKGMTIIHVRSKRKFENDARNRGTTGNRRKVKTVRVIDIPKEGSHRYKCSACFRTSSSSGNLYDHMRRVHKAYKIVLRRETDTTTTTDESSTTTGMDSNFENDEEETDDMMHVIDIPTTRGPITRKCSECRYTCEDISNMYKHMRRMHTGLKIAQRIRKKRRSAHEMAQSKKKESASQLAQSNERTSASKLAQSDNNKRTSASQVAQSNERTSASQLAQSNERTSASQLAQSNERTSAAQLDQSTKKNSASKSKNRKCAAQSKKRKSTSQSKNRRCAAQSKKRRSASPFTDEKDMGENNVDFGSGKHEDNELSVIESFQSGVGCRQYTCSKCERSYSDIRSAHGHMMSVHKGVKFIHKIQMPSGETVTQRKSSRRTVHDTSVIEMFSISDDDDGKNSDDGGSFDKSITERFSTRDDGGGGKNSNDGGSFDKCKTERFSTRDDGGGGKNSDHGGSFYKLKTERFSTRDDGGGEKNSDHGVSFDKCKTERFSTRDDGGGGKISDQAAQPKKRKSASQSKNRGCAAPSKKRRSASPFTDEKDEGEINVDFGSGKHEDNELSVIESFQSDVGCRQYTCSKCERSYSDIRSAHGHMMSVHKGVKFIHKIQMPSGETVTQRKSSRRTVHDKSVIEMFSISDDDDGKKSDDGDSFDKSIRDDGGGGKTSDNGGSFGSSITVRYPIRDDSGKSSDDGGSFDNCITERFSTSDDDDGGKSSDDGGSFDNSITEVIFISDDDDRKQSDYGGLLEFYKYITERFSERDGDDDDDDDEDSDPGTAKIIDVTKRRFKCSRCDAIYRKSTSVFRHIRRVHRAVSVVHMKECKLKSTSSKERIRKGKNRATAKGKRDKCDNSPTIPPMDDEILDTSDRSSTTDRVESTDEYEKAEESVSGEDTDRSDTVRIIDITPTKEGHKYKCSRCKFVCRNTSNVNKHMKRMHKGMRILGRKRGRRFKVPEISSGENEGFFSENDDVLSISENHDKTRKVRDLWDYSVVGANSDVAMKKTDTYNKRNNMLTSEMIARVKQEGVTVLSASKSSSHESERQSENGEDENVSTSYECKTSNTKSAKRVHHGRTVIEKTPKRRRVFDRSEVSINFSSNDDETSNTVHVIDIPVTKDGYRFKCSRCDAVSRDTSNLNKHMQRMHKDLTIAYRKRGRKLKSPSSTTEDSFEEKHDDVPAIDEDGGGKSRQMKDFWDYSVGISNDDTDISVSENSLDDGEAMMTNGGMEKVKHDGVTMLKMPSSPTKKCHSSAIRENDSISKPLSPSVKNYNRNVTNADQSTEKNQHVGLTRFSGSILTTFSDTGVQTNGGAGDSRIVGNVSETISMGQDIDNTLQDGTGCEDEDDIVQAIDLGISVPDGRHMYMCSECGLRCPRSSNMYKHMRTVHRGMRVMQVEPQRSARASFDRMNMDPKLKHFISNYEDESPDTVRAIEIPPTKEGRRFKCSRCDLVCSDGSNMNKHMQRVHKGMIILPKKRFMNSKSLSWSRQLDANIRDTSIIDNNENDSGSKNNVKSSVGNFWEYFGVNENPQSDVARKNETCKEQQDGVAMLEPATPDLTSSFVTADKDMLLSLSENPQSDVARKNETCKEQPDGVATLEPADQTSSFVTADKDMLLSLSENKKYEVIVVGGDINSQVVSTDNDGCDDDSFQLSTTNDKVNITNEDGPSKASCDDLISDHPITETIEQSRVGATLEPPTSTLNDNYIPRSCISYTEIDTGKEFKMQRRKYKPKPRKPPVKLYSSAKSVPKLIPVPKSIPVPKTIPVPVPKSVRVIDIPIQRGQMSYKCSQCDLVCVEVSNLYKHMRRIHHDYTIVRRPRKNKAWYS